MSKSGFTTPRLVVETREKFRIGRYTDVLVTQRCCQQLLYARMPYRMRDRLALRSISAPFPSSACVSSPPVFIPIAILSRRLRENAVDSRSTHGFIGRSPMCPFLDTGVRLCSARGGPGQGLTGTTKAGIEHATAPQFADKAMLSN